MTTRVMLATPVPVSIAYWTVFVADDGVVQFRPDRYGWDAQLVALLPDLPRGEAQAR